MKAARSAKMKAEAGFSQTLHINGAGLLVAGCWVAGCWVLGAGLLGAGKHESCAECEN
jgi:hypothetical protein